MRLSSVARSAVRQHLSLALRSHVVRAACAAGLRRSLKIVTGHYFGVPRPYVFEQPGMRIEDLEQALEILGQHFEFVALDRLLEDCGASGTPSRRLSVTLDDGFDLLREGAYDVFDRLKVPVTTFVIVDSIDNRALAWPNKLRAIEAEKGFALYRAKLIELHKRRGLAIDFVDASSIHVAMLRWPAGRKDDFADELWRACGMPSLSEYLDQHRPFYSLDQLRELLRRGHGIGLHTRSHPYCDALTGAEIEDEFVRPAEWLKRQLGLRAVPMAYPFGVRLLGVHERSLAEKAVVSCALGIGGFSNLPAGPYQLRRASLEGEVAYNVFAAPLIDRFRQSFSR